jgi:anti-anti-sigma regulatory factor
MSGAPAARSPNGVVVGRYKGTVMVTVHGELDPPKVAHLRLLLTDLIEDQGNVSVVVDLQEATAAHDDPGGLRRFAEATKDAHGRHAVVVFDQPSAGLHRPPGAKR